jgi:hypothetical protein
VGIDAADAGQRRAGPASSGRKEHRNGSPTKSTIYGKIGIENKNDAVLI